MKSKEVIKQSLQYIEERLDEGLKILDISGEMGYSEAYFSRMFKAEMHMTVMSYVKRRRLIRASDEILQGSRIIDTALRYGWDSHSGFTKAFRSEFGFCPALLKALAISMNYLGGSGMEHVFLKKTDEHAPKEELLQVLKSELMETGQKVDFAELEGVYQYACKVYNGMKRYSGDEYVTHPLNVAIFLAQMNADIHVVYAGMFCDVQEKTAVTADELKKNLPVKAASLVMRLEKIPDKQETAFLDEEAAMIRLAERLHNMRTVEYMPAGVWAEKAKETLDFTMSLAGKIGNRKLLDELNDLALKYISK